MIQPKENVLSSASLIEKRWFDQQSSASNQPFFTKIIGSEYEVKNRINHQPYDMILSQKWGWYIPKSCDILMMNMMIHKNKEFRRWKGTSTGNLRETFCFPLIEYGEVSYIFLEPIIPNSWKLHKILYVCIHTCIYIYICIIYIYIYIVNICVVYILK